MFVKTYKENTGEPADSRVRSVDDRRPCSQIRSSRAGLGGSKQTPRCHRHKLKGFKGVTGNISINESATRSSPP